MKRDFLNTTLFCFIFTFISSVLAAKNTGSSSSASDGGKVVVGYFPNWLYARYPVENIPFDKYTHINYAFALMTEGATPVWADPQQAETQLPALVTAAHAKNSKVLISIGGWSGCLTFSPMVASSSQRKTFIEWSIKQIKDIGIDGIDIDWEYPGSIGAGCNQLDLKNDAKNFLTLLQELKAAMDKEFGKDKKELTIAAHVDPFLVEGGGTMKDVSKYADVLTRVNLMTYDINGGWANTTGPNAPFNFQKGKGLQNSLVESIDAWQKAGMPYNKMTAGLAFYGRSTTAKVDMSKSKSQYQPQIAGVIPKGDSLDAYWQDQYCAKDPGSNSGVWRYGNLRSQGVLTSPTTAAKPWIRHWDDVSQTPWLFNPTDKTFVSYDDPKSIGIKVDYAACKNLAGVMVWSIDEDTDDFELATVANKIKSGSKSASCPK